MNDDKELKYRMMSLTPLHVSILEQRLDAVRQLTRARWFRKPSPKVLNAQDRSGRTPLHYATEGFLLSDRDFGIECVRLLLERGDDPNIADKWDGYTPLHYAAHMNQVVIAKLLLSNGANVHANANPLKQTPLHRAAWKWGHDVAPVLLDMGANINALDEKGQTPLHYSVRKLHLEMIQILILRGASRSIKDSEGKQAIDYLSASAGQYAASAEQINQISSILASGVVTKA